MKFDVRRQPVADVAELQRELTDHVDDLNDSERILKNVTVTTAQTTVAHGLRARPTGVTFELFDGEMIWESAQRDERNLYLKASNTVTVNVTVKR